MRKVGVGSIKITPETTQKRQKLAQLLHWCLCATLNMENRRRRKGISEDFRTGPVEKYQQSQGYKGISRDLGVPL